MAEPAKKLYRNRVVTRLAEVQDFSLAGTRMYGLATPGGGARAAYATFSTRWDLMHVVQTVRRFVRPFTFARTCWRFGSQRLRVRLWAWLMLLPETGRLPQMSHTFAIRSSSGKMLRHTR